MEEKKVNAQEPENNEAEELNLDELDQVSGGSIGNARTKKTVSITDDAAQRF